MSFVDDPARARKRSPKEKRKLLQEQCRMEPCGNMKKGNPPCVVCVHEGRLFGG